MANNNNIVITINGRNNTQQAFNQVVGSARQSAQKVSDAFKTVGTSMKSVGKAMTTAITLPVAGIVGSSVKVATEFEAQMSRVKAATKAPAEEMQDMTEFAKKMGATTKFTATEAAQGMESLGKAGWETKKIIAGLPGVMNLAASADTELGTAADIVAANLAAFNMEAGKAGRASDIISETAAATLSDVVPIGEALKYVSGQAGSMGYAMEDVALAIGLMANRGVDASMAGTSLRSALTNMANPTKEMKTWMDKIGLSLTDSQGNVKDFKTVLVELRQAFSGLSEVEKTQAAGSIFGKTAMSSMLQIINASEQEFNKLTSAIYSSSDGIGTAAEMSATMMDNLKGQLTVLKSAWEGIQLKIADSVLPSLKKLTSWFQKVADKINAMKPETLDLIVKFALVAAAIGPVIWIMGSLITNIVAIYKGCIALGTAIKTISAAISALNLASAFSPTIWIIAGIVVAVIGLTVLIVKNWTKIKNFIKDACDAIGKAWDKFQKKIEPGVKKATEAFVGFGKKIGLEKEFESVAKTVKDLKWWEWLLPTKDIKIFGTFIATFFKEKDVINKIKKLGKAVEKGFNNFMKPIKAFGKKIMDFFKRFMNNLKAVVLLLIANIYEASKKRIMPVIKFVKDLVKKIKTAITPIVNFCKSIITSIKSAFATGFQFVASKVTSVMKGIETAFHKLKIFYTNVINSLSPVLKIVESFKKAFDNAMEKVKEIFNQIMTEWDKFKISFSNFMTEIENRFLAFINSIIRGINFLTEKLNQIKIKIPGSSDLGIADYALEFNIPTLSEIPGLSIGTPEVLKDGLAVIHKGEAVVPAKVNPFTNRDRSIVANRGEQIIRVILDDNRTDKEIVLKLDGKTIAETVLKRANTLAHVRG